MPMMRLVATTLALAAQVESASAAGTGGCESFAWPLKTELSWIGASDPVMLQSGASVTALPAKAMLVTLVPQDQAALSVAPSGKQKAARDNVRAGIINFAGVPEPGPYHGTLSGPGWIDVVQNGVNLGAIAHTGKADCDGIRKSVRFNIGAGPFAIHLSGIPSETIKVMIRKSD